MLLRKKDEVNCPIGLDLAMFHVIIQDQLQEQLNSHMMILHFQLWPKELAMILLTKSI